MASRQDVLFSVFVAVEGLHGYSAVLPSVFTIDTFVADRRGVDAIRRGEIIGGVFSIGLGVLVAQMIDSPLPIYAAIIAAAFATINYEMALARTGVA